MAMITLPGDQRRRTNRNLYFLSSLLFNSPRGPRLVVFSFHGSIVMNRIAGTCTLKARLRWIRKRKASEVWGIGGGLVVFGNEDKLCQRNAFI
ncbi:hypothetical protein EVAR_13163_1 [Eumeta japonica]|uniref:Uncharacterized protein n=1 Tax=Eumeta variegata TaxID=151549 RepID=A0A4C1U9T0_EUMVA|nr:hypothetical protein EVAR_13163_1 [Eumeta japonica]